VSDDREFAKWKDVWVSFEPMTNRGSESPVLRSSRSWFFRVPGDVERQSSLEPVATNSKQFLEASLASLRQRRTRVLCGEGLALFLGVLMLVTTLVVEFDRSRGVAAVVAFGFIASMGVLLEIERRRLERSLRGYGRLHAELFGDPIGLDLPQAPEHARLWGGSRKKRRRPRTS
jgi:hypothetical protein